MEILNQESHKDSCQKKSNFAIYSRKFMIYYHISLLEEEKVNDVTEEFAT